MSARNVLANIKQKAAMTAAMALLVLVGSLVLLAAPHSNQSVKSREFSGAATSSAISSAISSQRNQARVADLPTATPSSPATVAPSGQPTATVAPTATVSAPTPTATPLVPTPTATPAPSWHTVGSYSGNASEADFATVAQLAGSGGNIDVQWTCTAPSGQWSISFTVATASGMSQTGEGAYCSNSSLSGTFHVGADASLGPGFDISATVGSPGGTWTATVLAWY